MTSSLLPISSRFPLIPVPSFSASQQLPSTRQPVAAQPRPMTAPRLTVVGPDFRPPAPDEKPDNEQPSAQGRPAAVGGAAPVASPAAPVVVLAGTAPSVVLAALVNQPDLPIPPAPNGGTWMVVRSGSVKRVRAYIPGHKQVETPTPGLRPPRRIEVELPSPVLNSITLACAPDAYVTDGAEIAPPADGLLLDGLTGSHGLVFAVPPAPFTPATLDFLGQAATRVDRIAFVLVSDADPVGRSTTISKLRGSLDALPQPLTEAPWYHLDDVAQLRQTLDGWVSATIAETDPTPTAAPTPAPPQPGECHRAPAVGTDDTGWRDALAGEIASRKITSVRRLRRAIADIRGRCLTALDLPAGCAALPHLLDRELHALSVTTTAMADADAAATAERVCAVLIEAAPAPCVRTRFLRAVGEAVEDTAQDAPPPRALLLTTTTAIAVVTGTAALDHLAAVRRAPPGGVSPPPLAIAVGSGCYRLWNGRTDAHTAGVAWLTRALAAVEAAFQREIERRLDDLARGIELVAAEAVDHGVLLV
jgi:hypothetical protein